MYLHAATIRTLEERYGRPRVLQCAAEFAGREFGLLEYCLRKRRAHDVTLFLGDGRRLALIRKHAYPPGLFRPPSGGVEPGEAFEAGAEREALEETGLPAELTRYLLRIHACFTHGGKSVAWTTHVFAAATRERELRVRDRHEIAEACWATPEAVHAVMRPRMLAVGSAGMQYRVALQDAALELLGTPAPPGSAAPSVRLAPVSGPEFAAPQCGRPPGG